MICYKFLGACAETVIYSFLKKSWCLVTSGSRLSKYIENLVYHKSRSELGGRNLTMAANSTPFWFSHSG